MNFTNELKKALSTAKEQLFGNLTEGLTFFALKDGNVMRRVGIDHSESGKTAPERDRCTPFV